MKRFRVVAKRAEKAQEVREHAEAIGFEYDERSPDFIICVGGDGTFLEAECQRPGVPKLLVRDSLVCYKCHDEPLDEMLNRVRRREWVVRELLKLEAQWKDRRMVAANDVVVRNVDQRHALRFRLSVNGGPIGETFIGDGVVGATPFGSTGYYRSVTRRTFDRGIGLGFNNPMTEHAPLELPETAEVALDVVRGSAYVTADNQPDVWTIQEADQVRIAAAQEVTRLLSHD